jgi:sterol desaturase/sphingolipid hydroxylase (fatty acid hydroxylase superfamily)
VGPNLIAFAIPLFFLAMGVELWVARRRGLHPYRFPDAFADMGCGILQQTGTLFLGVLILANYKAVHANHRLFDLSAKSVLVWAFTFLAVDLLYYVWHRLSHEVNFLWAVHVVHHQSEDYNLSVALRQAIFSGTTIAPFYLLLAWLGVPPLVTASCGALNTLYQFWIHTELVGKLGFLEKFLNTPSHHRVHHAINPQYLDRNYAGVFIVWDRLFRSFEEEREACVYGITRPLRSFNPLWAQFAEWVELARQARQTPRWKDKLKVWFASPAWHPPGVEVAPSPLLTPGYRKFDVPVGPALRWYVGAHFMLSTLAIFLLLLLRPSTPVLPAAALLIVLTLVAGGGLLERRAWAPALDLVRLVLLGGFGLALAWQGPWRYPVTVAAVLLLAGGWLARRAGRGQAAVAVPNG